MFRTFLISVCLAASMVACSTTSATRADTQAAAAKQQHPCINGSTTASRIPPNPNECATAVSPVRSYSGEDINRTGATDAANALRLLDPSITLGH